MEGFDRVVEQVGPTQYEAMADTAVLLNMSVSQVITQRLSLRRAGLSAAPAAAKQRQQPHLEPQVAATQGDELIALLGLAAQIAGTRVGNGAVWARVYGSRGEREDGDLLPGYDHEQHSVIAGIDAPVGEHVQVGGFLGIGDLNLDYVRGIGEADARHYTAGVYASVQKDAGPYLEIVTDVSYLAVEHERGATLTGMTGMPVTGTFNSDYHAWAGSAQLGVGLPVHAGALRVEPNVRAAIHYQHTPAYNEQGSGELAGLRMRVASSNYRTASLQAALDLSRVYTLDALELMPKLSLRYVLQEPLDDREVRLGFVLDPTLATVSVTGREERRHYYQQDASLQMRMNDRLSMTGNYRYTKGEDLQEHLLSLGLRYSF